MTLTDLARQVQTPEDLVAFLRAFSADLAANGSTWTNADLASFLEAMAAWVNDLDGYHANGGDDLTSIPRWRMVAELLMSARTYE